MQYFNSISERYVEDSMMNKELINEEVKMNPLEGQGLYEELESAAKV